MATEIRFYHLQQSTIDQALPLIVAKAYEKGHKILIHCTDQASANHIDTVLWTYDPNSFLPHDCGNESTAPVYITNTQDNKNNADVLIILGGQAPANMNEYALCCDIFDGAKDDQLQAARARWKKWRDEKDLTLSYFQQNENGGWEKKA